MLTQIAVSEQSSEMTGMLLEGEARGMEMRKERDHLWKYVIHGVLYPPFSIELILVLRQILLKCMSALFTPFIVFIVGSFVHAICSMGATLCMLIMCILPIGPGILPWEGFCFAVRAVGLLVRCTGTSLCLRMLLAV